MPGIAFTNLAMLVGLVALSVPVVIHLLLRRKKKRLRFSTVQFFLQRDERSSQRRKLQNWLLLALRLLICALLVLVFARPYLPNSGLAAAYQKPQRIVVVLDRSLSMQAHAANGPKWTQAIDAAHKVLQSLSPKDRAALVSCGPRAEVLQEWAPASVVDKALTDLRPDSGAGNMAEALQQANRLISVAEAQDSSTICVISDFQRSTCAAMDSVKLPKKTELKLTKIGDLLTPNLALTDLQLQSNEGLPPHLAVSSYSDEDARNLAIKITIDGATAPDVSVSLPAGSSTNLTLAFPQAKPGWHNVRIQAQAQDALPADDTRYGVLFVPEPARVFVAETRAGQRPFEQESFFLSAALDPTKDSTNGWVSRYAVSVLSPDEITHKLATAKAGALPCDLVVLPGLKQLPGALGSALANFVRAGGGALLFTGEGLSANRYNAELKEILPARVGALQSSADWESAWRIGVYATNTPLFAPFQTDHSGDLSLPRFTRRVALEGAEEPSVVARFQDGAPFVVSRSVGQGHVVLVNTSVDASWNDWPKHKTFVPWVHGTAKFLLPQSEEKTMAPEPHLAAGTVTDLDLGTSFTNAVVKLHGPEAKERSLTADQRGQVHDVTFPTPGVYVLQDSAGRELRRMAVNVPAAESDLASWGAADVEQRVARAPEEPTTLSAGLLGTSGNQRELWRVLLLALLGLLMIELVVANRTVA